MKFAYRRSATDDQVIEVDIVPVPERPGSTGSRWESTSSSWPSDSCTMRHSTKKPGEITLQFEGREYRLFDASQRRRPAPTRAGDLHAPMAGKIIRVLVQPGEHVKAGATLLILEAMKMEQQITAPQDGVVTRLLCRAGDQVTAGTELVVMEPAAAV